ncbi:MAG: hypothetical protein ACI867_001015 [Glaciecola sp.]|jgi:hypothetical protein
MNSSRFTAILFTLALVLGLLSALDVVAPEIGNSSTLTTAEAARSGSWTCPAAGLAEDAELTISAVVPPAAALEEEGEGDAPAFVPGSLERRFAGAGVPSQVTYNRFGQGSAARVGRAGPFAEQAVNTTIGHPQFPPVRDEFAVAARWRRQPAALGRSYERSSAFGPGGLLAAPCVSGSSSMWVLPGLSTAGGAEATIVLSNPFASDASVTVTLATELGPEQPSLLENVVVPAQSVRLLALNEHAPERRDVGVVIRSRSGRVVVEALQSVNAAIGGIEGVTIVPAAPAGASTWTIPWVGITPSPDQLLNADAIDGATGQGQPEADASDAAESPEAQARVIAADDLPGIPSSWVWVTNVGEDDAVLLVTVHGPDGGVLAEIGADAVLAPGAIRRISLDGLAAGAATRAAVTVATENDVPIVASVATQVAANDEERTGLTVQLGASAPDDVWVLPGESPAGRFHLIAVVNPSGDDAVVAISLWTSAGIARPEAVQEVLVPPGTFRLIDISDVLDPELGSSVVFVQAVTGRVVAGRVGYGLQGRLDIVANIGIPSSVWSGGTLVPTTRFDPSLTGEVSPSEEPRSAP